ncbi:MAG: isoprenylcysteine carboxylmethyltransferase family protein [Gemmatimonadota bacterium]|nr:MAG: isoprenylcysteine carboxylmethyltransferase family protein [Gemmatimonadota bacterium]
MSESADTEKETRRPQLLDWSAGAAFLALIVLDRFIERGGSRLLYRLGIICLLAAPVLFIPPFVLLKKHGQVDAGRSFFCTKVTVDRGLYAVVRHPQYLGYILLALGFMLLSQHLATLSLGAIAIICFYLYTLEEEQFCVRRFGVAYEEYCRRVPRFNIVSGVIRYLVRKRWTE